MSESAYLTYYQRKRDVILNRAKDYLKMMKRDQENRQDINIETYLKKKKIKREYGKNRYVNVSEEKKKRLKEYQKNYR